MIRFSNALLLALALSSGCVAQGSFHANASVNAEIDLPIAKMPPKYASWVVEADGYLKAVNQAFSMYDRATADLAAALHVKNDANAIAEFLRSSIKVKTTMECTPPSFSAGVVSECTASAGARASGNAGNGGASGQASAGIQANCEASASLSYSPGKCVMKTEVSQNPIFSDPARWATIEASMKTILQLHAANRHLDGHGAEINVRGLKLNVEAYTDLAKDPTLALQLNNIQAELKKGADACGKANDKQRVMTNDLGTMSAAIDAQFPDLHAAIRAN